tara:strand:- start:322 stop:576 length:255 start_codon:yes stop_codon:yes gene_type:complete
MLSRLGIALHWLSFVWTASWIIVFLVLVVLGSFGEIGFVWSETAYIIIAFASLYVFPVMALGWIANFIFNKHKHPLPWRKENNS